MLGELRHVGEPVNLVEAVLDPARLAALQSTMVLDSAPEQVFDDLAHLAARLCATPVALVSLVDRERQWFKARVGFPLCQTDLDSSVCKFVLTEPDLLVIPDLLADQRTSGTPLVTGEPRIRFYAGAPLFARGGEVLGSLCVIDTLPRLGGLTVEQADDLRRLARQVSAHLDMRRVVEERAAAQSQLSAGEAYWRQLFERIEEGFVLGEVIRDGEGQIADWRYLQVNPAWGALVGVRPADAVGRSVREVFPGIEQAWIDIGDVVDTREPITFTQQVGQLGQWYEGHASALGADSFVVLFFDVSARFAAERRLATQVKNKSALAELGDCLRSASDAKAMSYVAGAITGETLGAMRAGYGTIDPVLGTVAIDEHWCAPGIGSIAGEHSLRDYGTIEDALVQGGRIVIQDVRTDSRTCSNGAVYEPLDILSMINVPVIENGKPVGLLFAHWSEPQQFAFDEEAFIQAAADRTRASIARTRSEEQQALLNGEISHRLKNLIAMVQAIATQTLKGASDKLAVQTFNKRLLALSNAHELLLRQDNERAGLAEVVQRVLKAAGADDHFDAFGPEVMLGARATLSTSLLLHELTTNAIKYGALSTSAGRIEVRWLLTGEAGREVLALDWSESGGPPAAEPTRTGFGSRLLRQGLVGTGGVVLSYTFDGLRAHFTAPLASLQAA